MIGLSKLLDLVWLALRGNGTNTDFVVVYTAIGALLWSLLLFKVFLQEGIQVAMGSRSELPKILVKYLFVAGMFSIWPQLSGNLFAGIRLLAVNFYPDLDTLLDAMAGSLGTLSAADDAAQNAQGLTSAILGTLYNFTVGSLLSIVGMLVVFVCWALVLVNIAGSLTILAMNLVLGPVFFALAFDRDFRGHAQKWLAAVLSYTLLIPLYGAALSVAGAIAGATASTNLFGLPSGPQVLAQVIGPILSVGVVFSTNKVVNALVGGAAGSGAGSMALGMTGAAAHMLPGGAMLRSTGAAVGAAARAGAGAAKAVGQKLSSTARAALGK
jgi:TrbL/VirB6 plasmid conjugal transfer protein